MTQKIFLTSALAIGVIAPAMAEPSNTGTFPSTGLMQEDYTYTNAATAENMAGVYEDSATVDAVAEYTDILYNIAAGNYLKAGSDATNGTTCPAGSWCPGLTNATYNETADQGINSCPSEYGLSAAGTSSQNDCYRECTNADVEHSTGTMNGGYYYGNNNQCEPTACENGWHLKQGLNLTSTIGAGEGENIAYINISASFGEQNFDGKGAKGQSYYGINGANTWAVDYGTNGMLTGQARCSTQSGTNNNYTWTDPTITANLVDETGQEGAQYCYCNVTGYTPNGGTLQAMSSPWVFNGGYGAAVNCANGCVTDCAIYMHNTNSNYLALRAALVGSATGTGSLASCEANEITINWYNADAEDISANNAGTATYGSDVRTPVKAQTIKGKTFKGWRFSKPQQTNLPE